MKKLWVAVGATTAIAAVVAVGWHRTKPAVAVSKPDSKSVLARLPLAFEPNQGQTDGAVRYMARGSGFRLFLTSSEAVVALDRRDDDASATGRVKAGSPAAASIEQSFVR